MRRYGSACSALVVVLVAGSTGAAVFEDDFSSGTLDPGKWSVDVSSGSTVAVVGNAMKATINSAPPQHAYAVSQAIALPGNWTAIAVTGRWYYASPSNTGESVLRVFNGGTYVQTGYAHYNPSSPIDNFREYDSTGWSKITNRAVPHGWVDFQLDITPTGWAYVENGSALVNRATNHMAGLSTIQLQLGLWDASSGSEAVYFDDLVVDVVPEPGTFGLLLPLLLGIRRSRPRPEDRP